MAITDQFIQVAADGVGKKVDNSEVIVGANTVERQRVNISDPSDPNAHMAVTNVLPPPRTYGTVSWIAAEQLPLPTQDSGLGLALQSQDDGSALVGVQIKLWGDELPPLGPRVSGQSIPVAIASDQSAIPITAQNFHVTVDGGTITDLPGPGWNQLGFATDTGPLAAMLLLTQTQLTETMTAMLTEMRVQSQLLQSGLNVRDDLDSLRNDPYILN